MTNEEKLKGLSTEELAEKLNESFACDRCPIDDLCECIVGGDCTKVWIEWLKSEAENND